MSTNSNRAMAKPKSLAPSWLDRFLIGVFPTWGLRRYHARANAMVAARHYDAAASSRRTEGWTRRASDANSAAQGAIIPLRELSRDLLRNNAWARRGVNVIANNVVGWGIDVRMAGGPKQAPELWKSWADSLQCDYDGLLNFAGLQRLVMQTVVASGEALAVRYAAHTEDGLAVPVRVRVLEPDFLDMSKIGATETGYINQGVEFDRGGRRVAYWLFETHPGAVGVMPNAGNVSKRFEAKDVAHVYQVERPGQIRGVPWLAAAIARLNDFDDFEDAQLMQQKIAACFGAFVQDTEGLGTPGLLGEQSKKDERIETLQPGQIEYLPPGKTITFAQPPTISDGLFTQRQHRAVAANLGVTYEDLTGDYSQVNYSSARMARLAHWQNVEQWRWHMLIPQFCAVVWNWVMNSAGGLEGWQAVPQPTWATPPMPMLEPDKEGLAYQRLIRSGAMTYFQVLRENGLDPKTHLAEIAESNKELDRLGIWLDSDPRRTSTAGLTQERPGGTIAGVDPLVDDEKPAAAAATPAADAPADEPAADQPAA